MATIIDALVVSLGLDPSEFDKGQKKAVESLRKLEQSSDKTTKNLQEQAKKGGASFAKFRNEVIGLTAALLGTSAIKAFADRITTSDSALGYMSKNLGMTTEDLSAWTKMSEKAGGSAESTANALKTLSSRIYHFSQTGEGGEAFKYFNTLRVAILDTQENVRPLTDVLLESADKLKEMAETKGRPFTLEFAKGMGIDEGLFNVLVQGRKATEQYIEEQRKLAVVTEADTKAATSRDIAWKKLGDRFENIGRKLLTDLTPIILKLANDFDNWIKKIDIAKIEKFFSQFVDGGGKALDIVGGLTNAIEILFGLFVASKFLPIITGLEKLTGALSGALGVTKLLSGGLSLLGKGGLAGAVVGGGYLLGTEINKQLSDETKGYIDKAIDFVDESISNVGGKLKGLASSAFGALISRGEGGYSSVNLGEKGNYKSTAMPLAGMTVSEIMDMQKRGEVGAVGRYQIIGKTLKEAAEKMHLKGTEKFDKEFQDRIFEEYLIPQKRKDISDYITGKSSDLFAALKAMAQEWASFTDPETGKSYYDKIAGNKATISVQEMTEKLQQARANFMGNTANTNNTSSTDVNVGQVSIYTQSTDAPGIARDINSALQSYTFASQANVGLF